MTGPYPPSGAQNADPTGEPAAPGGYPPAQYPPPYPAQYPAQNPPPYPAQYPAQYAPPAPADAPPAAVPPAAVPPADAPSAEASPASVAFPPPRYAAPATPTMYGAPVQPEAQGTVYGQPAFPPPVYPGESGYQPPPPPARKKSVKTMASVGAGLLVIVVAILAKTFVGNLLDGNASPTHAQPTGTYATSDATAPPTAPFEDTPAASYAVGADGIKLPAANAVKGFTKSQVDAGLKKVKQALVASRLDTKMLVDHDPAAFLALIAPDGRGSIQDDFSKKNFFVYASQIASGHTLAVEPVRVSGRVTYRAATHDGIRMLEVITNFVWVYPFSGELKAPGDHLVTVHDEVTWVIPVDADVEKSSRGMFVYDAQGYAYNMDCALLDQSLLGLGKPVVTGPGDSTDVDELFDPNGSLDIKSNC